MYVAIYSELDDKVFMHHLMQIQQQLTKEIINGYVIAARRVNLTNLKTLIVSDGYPCGKLAWSLSTNIDTYVISYTGVSLYICM